MNDGDRRRPPEQWRRSRVRPVAYGGLGAAHLELAPHYDGVAELDSLTVDPRKTLNVPISSGAALVANPTGCVRSSPSKRPIWTETMNGRGCRKAPWS